MPADLAWDDGGEYARAAEAAGVDVGGMLEAGVDAKHLLEFVSNYRKEEGDKLGLLDEQNLKFATSQVLRKGPRAGNQRPRRPPTTATGTSSAWGFGTQGETDEASRRAVDCQSRRTRKRTSPNPEVRQSARVGIGNGNTHRTGGRPSAPVAFGEDDGVETARLRSELLRWSSALEGAEKQLGGNGGPAGMESWTGGGIARARHVAKAAPAEDAKEEGSEQSTPSRQVDDDESFDSDQEDATHHDRPASTRVEERRNDRSDTRRSRRQRDEGEGEVSGDRDRHRSHSPEVVDDVVEVWEESEGEPACSSSRRPGGRVRGSISTYGHARPTPSYALPTKHFKTPDRDRRHAVYAEDARGQKQMQRQAHLEEENAALKLRLEGLRRAIHELEHQANTLRDDARIREEEFSRLKKKLAATPSSVAGGKCSCCASTHHGRQKAAGENGPSALKKRALAAEGRTETLERCLRESKAKEQRSREIVASLKHSYSAAQAKAVSLEAELESTRNSLSEARQEIVESRRGAKGRLKETRKQRRQQGEKEREAETARAQAADLAGKLRKASREIERARLEAVKLREEKARVEGESQDLARENRMLQDRLSDGKLRSRTRERDRWILAELRSHSQSRSPSRRRAEGQDSRRDPPPTASRPAARQRSLTREDFRARNDGVRRRHLGVQDASFDSASDSEPSVRCRSLSPPPNPGLGEGRAEGAGGRWLPPRDSRRVPCVQGRVGGSPGGWGGTGRGLSTRSADGAEGPPGDAAVLRGSSTLSGGSANGTMKARYERLQAMYRRVNRREAGARGRSGVA
ncbi:expressed unknown protein [Ectocarpus siliculosus]|uniref:Uncharacterized protein n=1 Tax=Ectocarpus siliculosus TaxID=2880 RepID=D7FQU4_ECTSI|nr:expressed unknown protein [Ectocarpus siliculosus]|eukprot:CBJ30654.1 expressed unknown protein [Ectocarpus siliculosus]